jgi:hypothetical protein
MKALELKIPPAIVLLPCLILACKLSQYLPILTMPAILFDIYWYNGTTGFLLALAGI